MKTITPVAVKFTSIIEESYIAQSVKDCKTEAHREIFAKIKHTGEAVQVGLTIAEPVWAK